MFMEFVLIPFVTDPERDVHEASSELKISPVHARRLTQTRFDVTVGG